MSRASDAAVYQPSSQVRRWVFLNQMTFVVRTPSDPSRLVPAVRTVLQAIDPDLPAMSIASMSDLVSETTSTPRFQARLFGTFAIVALAMAVVGLYSVLAYAVVLRRREFGIRRALGAQDVHVVGLILRKTVGLSAAGVVIGAVGAWSLARVLERAVPLFNVTPRDPAVFAAVATGLFAAALAASLAPALRARRVDPIIAIKEE
jgi:putative ABC transport system permease protein